MLLSVRVNNYMVYSDEVEISLFARENVKRFYDNVYSENGVKALKSACIYGANNSGKTCLVNAIRTIKNVLLNRPRSFNSNLFTDGDVIILGVSFLIDGRAFSYDFKYNTATKEKGDDIGFVFECLKEIFVDENGDQYNEEIFLRDIENVTYRFKDGAIPGEAMKGFSSANILVYGASEDVYSGIVEYKNILTDFAQSVDIIGNGYFPLGKATDALKKNSPLKGKIVDLIRMADLDIENFEYIKNPERNPDEDDEDVASRPDRDIYHLFSYHRGKPVRSVDIDSSGTNKVISLAGYIIDALENGRTLVVDELDSGLHFKLTRALVLLFNNLANDKGGQLIFTTHDVTLLDCDKIFRQDQIWFVCRDSETEYLYSLADFNFSDEEVCSEFKLLKKYKEGALGLIPRPDFLTLMVPEVKGDDENE